ncbi:low molecular weight phosphatase family protein [Demequina sp. SYSU T00192]|uniref:Low molecular weight phosphatase family protein n=1 Tax=Demequina litoralis TaxID=3051660 RepID=A0ABT8G8L4_9MICO|nr:low molecular weight phosphatase family protein [Demequina sp. SYSU T00192]MDN4475407.1 low molecular weight phosphatase family protein [Demequina sp. SYSU T00192]
MPTILTVCTGNICRSPAAELLLAEALRDVADVASAGTHALVGHGIPAPMLSELEADAIDGGTHAGRLLTEAVMRDSDLVITMTAEHRQLAVRTGPFALKRTFTLAELAAAAGTGAALEGATAHERLADIPRAVAAHRHVLAGYELADVPDPYRRDQDAYHEAYTLIRGAVAEIAAWVLDSSD